MADTATGYGVRERLNGVLSEYYYGSPPTLTDDTSFIDDLGLDSLVTVEIVMAAEDEFDIEISDAEAETVLTIRDAVRMIEAKIVARQKGGA